MHEALSYPYGSVNTSQTVMSSGKHKHCQSVKSPENCRSLQRGVGAGVVAGVVQWLVLKSARHSNALNFESTKCNLEQPAGCMCLEYSFQ